MAHPENARRDRPASSVRRGVSGRTTRARLLVHEDAVACLVAADAAARAAPGPDLARVRSILRELAARTEGLAAARESGAVVVPLPPERRAEYFPPEEAPVPQPWDVGEADA